VVDGGAAIQGSLFCAESADELLISICGEYDMTNSQELSDAIGTGTSRRILLNFARATYIDASVIGILAHHARLRRGSNDSLLRVVGLNPNLQRVFQVCKLSMILDTEQL
jgi:anti-anti-sigma factor